MPGQTTTDCRKATEYMLGNTHEVWVGKDFITPENPTSPTETLTTTAVAAVGTNVTISLATALVNKYYKTQRIRFQTAGAGAYKVIALAADAEVGATTLIAKEVKTEIPSGDAAVEVPMVPYWSVRATQPTVTGESKEIRAAGACDWSSFLMVKRGHTSNVNGPQVRADPGHLQCEKASCSTEELVFIRMIKSDQTAWEGDYWVSNYEHPHETDTEVTVGFQLTGDGPPARVDEYAVA